MQATQTTKDRAAWVLNVNTPYFIPKTSDKDNLKLICADDKVKTDLCKVNENFLKEHLVVFVMLNDNYEFLHFKACTNFCHLERIQSDFRF